MLSDTIFYAPTSGQTIQKAMIMLHGYGADGTDLISMAPHMASALPDTVFYAPNAPTPMPITGGYKWFDLDEGANDAVYEQFSYIESLMEKAKAVIPEVQSFVDMIKEKHHLQSDQIVLMGFSQGGLLALMMGLMYSPQIAGLIGCSAVPVAINNAMPITAVQSKPPVLLTHGMDDDVVPYMGMQISQNTLKNIGCVVQTHIVPGMGHDIDESSVRAIIEFTQKL